MQGKYLYGFNDYIHYVVKSGDSLYLIAKKYNTTVDELKKLNHLYSNMIYPNQILLIPINNSNTSANMGNNTTTNLEFGCGCEVNVEHEVKNNVNNSTTYLTNDGESLSDILKKFDLRLDDLSEYNDIDRLRLEGNQLLMVEKKENKKVHKVKYNDTVEDIMAKYQLSPYDLLKLNEKQLLNPGNEIIIEK